MSAEPWSAAILRGVAGLLRRCPGQRIRQYLEPFCRNLQRSPFQQDLNQEPFPFPVMLQSQITMLRNNGIPLSLEIPADNSQHTVYNFWKAVLAGGKNANYEHLQEQEARVRLFANMYWAGFLSMVPLSIGFLLSLFHVFDRSWRWPMAAAFSISLLIAFTIGSQLRRVRGQEVFSLFTAYVALKIGSPTPD